MSPEPRLVTTAAELRLTCERLAAAPHVAVDTEFLRERTYHARLCLVQLASPTEHALVDPFAVEDLSPLRELLVASDVIKVFHAARQDLEIFHSMWGAVPQPLFDTQVAAAILGHGDQLSYAALVQALLDVRIDKAQTLTDWSRRPLSSDQLRYALDDVVHLSSAYELVRTRLAELGRAEWLARTFESMADPALYRVDPREAWRAVKGTRGLSGEKRAVLREVAAWREEAARERDLPRRWVLSDEALVEVARRAPRTGSELAGIRTLTQPQLRRDGEALVEAVRAGLAAPADERPARPPERPGDEALALADLMAAVVRLRARAADVSVGQVATRADLEALAMHGEASGVELLEGWRRELVGAELLALREGRLRLAVKDGLVVVEDA